MSVATAFKYILIFAGRGGGATCKWEGPSHSRSRLSKGLEFRRQRTGGFDTAPVGAFRSPMPCHKSMEARGNSILFASGTSEFRAESHASCRHGSHGRTDSCPSASRPARPPGKEIASAINSLAQALLLRWTYSFRFRKCFPNAVSIRISRFLVTISREARSRLCNKFRHNETRIFAVGHRG